MAIVVTDLEYTVNAGATWSTCTADMDSGGVAVVIPVGDVDAPAGTIGVRVKAKGWAQAGPPTWNALPFTKGATVDYDIMALHLSMNNIGAGGVLTDDAHGNHATLVNATDVIQEAGAHGMSITLPGTTGRYATVPNSSRINIAGDITIVVSVFIPSRSGFRCIMEKNFYLEVDGSGFPRIYVNPQANGGTKYATGTTAIPLNAWTQLGITITAAGLCTFHINAGVTNSHNIGVGLATNTSALYIGAMTDGSTRWLGRLDEIYLFNRILTSAELLDLLMTNTPPMVAGGGSSGGGGGGTETPTGTARFYRTFEETSPLSGVNVESGHSYSATVSTTRALNGTQSLRLELRATDADVAGSRRVELNLSYAAQRKEWYAFALYLPSANYSTPDPHAEQFCQWHAVPDSGEDWGTPAKSVQLVNNKIRVKIGYNDNAIGRTVLGEQVFNMPTALALDTWHRFVFEIYHDHRTVANGGQGMFKMWINDELKVDHVGPNSFNDQALPYFKIGCYKWPWATEYNGQYVTAGCNPRILYFDEIKIGNHESNYTFMRPPGSTGGGGGGPAVIQMDTTDPTTLTGWENNVAMTNSNAVGGVITVQNRRFRSLNSDVPALDFGEGACSGVAHILIENCDFYGAGFMIKSWYNNNKVTIRNCRFWGAPVTAWTSYKKTRRAAKINGVTEFVFENNFLKGTAGIAVDTTGSDIAKLQVRYNIALNIDGRVQGSFEHSQFLQIIGKGKVCNDGEVGWNYVLNEPNRSWVEDNINLYNIGGLSTKRLKVHHNFIKGAFYDPYDTVSPYYSGGGIICDSSNAEGHGQVDTCTRYVDVEDNYIVGSNNYSLSVATGRDIAMRRNTVICKGYIDAADVTRIGGTGRLTGDPSGINVRDFYAPGVISNIVVDSNKVGVFKWDTGTSQYVRRTGYFTDAGVAETNRINIADPVNESAENALLTEWLNAAGAAGVTLGVQS